MEYVFLQMCVNAMTVGLEAGVKKVLFLYKVIYGVTLYFYIKGSDGMGVIMIIIVVLILFKRCKLKKSIKPIQNVYVDIVIRLLHHQ